MKTLSLLTMIAALIGFCWLAFYSLAYVETKKPELTLGEMVLKAGEEAEAYHKANDTKPVVLKGKKSMTKAEKRQAMAYLFASDAR